MEDKQIKDKIEWLKNMVSKGYMRGVSKTDIEEVIAYTGEPFQGKFGCGSCYMSYIRMLMNKNLI